MPVLRQVDAWLHQSVESAVTQTVPCEVLVVAAPGIGRSNLDLLSRLVSRYPALRVVRQPGKGFAAALNLGIRTASSARVGFLLSDDWLEPEAVKETLGSPADIVSTGQTVYAADGRTSIDRASRIPTREEYDRLPGLESKADYLSHFFLFRRGMLLQVGGLDETLGDSPGVDDYDLIWTLLEHGATVGLIERSLYNYRDHDGERLTLRKSGGMMATLVRILDKHHVKGPARGRVLARHSKWFGKPISAVLREDQRQRKLRTLGVDV
ncbi:MAG: glycosyltransferase [Bryobacteraceae bacterium]|nr:glycosyltransferase [Bryobacteraceae bacterium]